MNWREFKPTIFFLLKFLGLYLISNLAYGFFITSYEPKADPITYAITDQAAATLSLVGWPSDAIGYQSRPTVSIVHQQRSVVSVYEGCNGVNVMIIFLAFLISFGPRIPRLYWFIPLGLVLIHIFNLFRICLLFFVSLRFPHYLYFTHKYLFTALIYAVVLILWLWWVRKISIRKPIADA